MSKIEIEIKTDQAFGMLTSYLVGLNKKEKISFLQNIQELCSKREEKVRNTKEEPPKTVDEPVKK